MAGKIDRFLSKYLSRRGAGSFLSEPSITNSLYILMANIFSAGFGLLFWVVAARNYAQEDVGLATALVSIAGVVLLVSRLGVDQSMTRFLPGGNRSSIYSTSVIVTTVLSIVFGVGYLLTAGLWSPGIQIGWGAAVVLLVLMASWSVALTSNMAFVAIREARVSFVQTLVMGTRVLVLFVTTAMGAVGIIGAYAASFVLAVIYGQIIFARLGIFVKEVDWQFIKDSMRFSSGNWVSGLLDNLPLYILPVLVFGYLGAAQTAEYYMAYSFASIVFMFPRAFATQMYVEGCHGTPLRDIVARFTSLSFLTVVPIIAALYLVAPWLLGLLGGAYAENGLSILRLLAFSSLFWIPYKIHYHVKMVQKDMRGLVLVSLFNCVLVLGLSFALMTLYGLDGIGYAWIIGYGVISLTIALLAVSRRRGA